MTLVYDIVKVSEWPRADMIAVASAIISVVAFLLALITLHRGNLNSSAATAVSLHAEIRDRWDEYLAAFQFSSIDLVNNSAGAWIAIEDRIADKLEKLMNVLELAAAIEVEGTLSGVSQRLIRDYLRRTLATIIADSYTSEKVSTLLQDETTFIYIRRFIGDREKLYSVLPENWYAYPQVSWIDRARSLFRY